MLVVFSKGILVAAGIEPEMAEIVHTVLFYVQPHVFLRCLCDSLKKYLAACRVFIPPMYIYLTLIIVQIFLLYLLVPSYGLLGVIWASNITYLYLFVVVCLYIKQTGCIRES